MVHVVSGAGVTNLMFLRRGAVVLFSMPVGCYGFTSKSYGKMLPWSGVHTVYLKGRVEGPSESEGWLGMEDEESRLGKDADIRIPVEQFHIGVKVGTELLREGVVDVDVNGIGEKYDVTVEGVVTRREADK
jgi:hypothetical protein